MKRSTDELLGKRFKCKFPVCPDVTVVVADPQRNRIRLHAIGGGKVWIPFEDFESMVRDGSLVESLEAPFAWD